jgi:hypothetical protein
MAKPEKGIEVQRTVCANDPNHDRPFGDCECEECHAFFCRDCFAIHKHVSRN